MNQAQVLSTYQAAKLCNVHHTTVINWVNDGVLPAYTTPGGHRRIKHDDILAFMKKFNIPIPEEIQDRKKRILVVDDDAEALEEITDALDDGSFEFDVALNGFEAGRKIYSKLPDIILLDFKMPGMDGFQVCEVLHRDKKTTHIPVIAVTIMTSKADIKRIKDCGVVAYHPKPVDIDKLKKTINKILHIEQITL